MVSRAFDISLWCGAPRSGRSHTNEVYPLGDRHAPRSEKEAPTIHLLADLAWERMTVLRTLFIEQATDGPQSLINSTLLGE